MKIILNFMQFLLNILNYGSNERAIIAALAKVEDCKDFVLPRKRGCPRKAMNRNKEWRCSASRFYLVEVGSCVFSGCWWFLRCLGWCLWGFVPCLLVLLLFPYLLSVGGFMVAVFVILLAFCFLVRVLVFVFVLGVLWGFGVWFLVWHWLFLVAAMACQWCFLAFVVFDSSAFVAPTSSVVELFVNYRKKYIYNSRD